MSTAISYRRFSSKEQAKGTSIQRQERLLRHWLAKHPEHRLDNELTDAGVSGYKLKNVVAGALGVFIEAIKRGQVKAGSILVVESIDRLGRAKLDTMHQLIRSILISDVAIQTLSPEKYLDKSSLDDLGALNYILGVAARANEESAIKSERSRASWQIARENAPAKQITSHRPSWIDTRDGQLVVNHAKAKIIRKIFAQVYSRKRRDAHNERIKCNYASDRT